MPFSHPLCFLPLRRPPFPLPPPSPPVVSTAPFPLPPPPLLPSVASSIGVPVDWSFIDTQRAHPDVAGTSYARSSASALWFRDSPPVSSLTAFKYTHYTFIRALNTSRIDGIERCISIYAYFPHPPRDILLSSAPLSWYSALRYSSLPISLVSPLLFSPLFLLLLLSGKANRPPGQRSPLHRFCVGRAMLDWCWCVCKRAGQHQCFESSVRPHYFTPDIGTAIPSTSCSLYNPCTMRHLPPLFLSLPPSLPLFRFLSSSLARADPDAHNRYLLIWVSVYRWLHTWLNRRPRALPKLLHQFLTALPDLSELIFHLNTRPGNCACASFCILLSCFRSFNSLSLRFLIKQNVKIFAENHWTFLHVFIRISAAKHLAVYISVRNKYL